MLTIFGISVMLVDPLLAEQSSQEAAGRHRVHRHAGRVWPPLLIRPDSYGTRVYSAWCASTPSASSSTSLSCSIAPVVILTSFEYLDAQASGPANTTGSILFGTVGMMLMSSAVELVLIFIALEISSISTYILAGFRRRAAESAEASLKYFLLGSFATAFFLYGVALIFGATGTTNVYGIAASICTDSASTLAYLAVALMFVGLGFKVASAPFHVWTPDVYEGCARSGCGTDVHWAQSRRLCGAAARALRRPALPAGSGWSGSRPFSR